MVGIVAVVLLNLDGRRRYGFHSFRRRLPAMPAPCHCRNPSCTRNSSSEVDVERLRAAHQQPETLSHEDDQQKTRKHLRLSESFSREKFGG